MPQRIEERVRPITPQLAWRVAVLGGIAFVLFAIVFFRLWYLQVLTGDQARLQGARQPRAARSAIEAPRGDIVDRNNVKLVRTKQAAVVQIVPSQLPESVRDQADEYRKALAAAEQERLRGAPTARRAFERQLRDDGRKSTKDERSELRRLREGRRHGAHGRRSRPRPRPSRSCCELYRRVGEVIHVAADDDPRARDPRDRRRAVLERHDPHRRAARAVQLHARAARVLPRRRRHQALPAPLPARRDSPRSCSGRSPRSPTSSSRCDELQRGSSRARGSARAGSRSTTTSTCAASTATRASSSTRSAAATSSARSRSRDPKQGQRLKLTLDFDLQKAGDAALEQAIANSEYQTNAGAWIAMDPRDGAILGMGSKPGFDASVFAKPISQKTYEFLTSDDTGAPLLNRVTESGYPTGSTFKPVTALAALDEGLINPRTTINDTGHLEIGTQEYQNAKEASFGTINASDALKVSSDIFFFQLGAWANDRDRVIQRWAKRLGFGRKTGIDLPGEAAGPRARRRVAQRRLPALQRVRREGRPGRGHDGRRCTSAAGSRRPGRRATTSTSPSARATCRRRRCSSPSPTRRSPTTARSCSRTSARRSRTATASSCRTSAIKPRRKIKLNQRDRQVVLDGLRRAANEEKGTSADVFAGWPRAVHGLRQDRHGRARAEPRPGVVRLLRQGRRAADRRRRDRREGRLRREHGGTRGAPDPLRVVRCARPRVPRRDERDAMSAQTIQPASEPPPPLVPREWRLRLDPLLLLATLGLVACSLIALKGATADDIDADPLYYVKRQGVYIVVGLVLMYGVSRHRLLAAARAALPDLRRADRVAGRRAGAGAGHTRRPGVDRAAGLQPAAVRARQGAARRRAGRLRRRADARDGAPDDGARDAARAAADDARDGRARPRVGHRLRRRHARDPVRRGRAVAPFRGAAGAVRGQRHVRARRRAEARRRGARALPGGSPDRVPAPVGGSRRRRLPAGAGADRRSARARRPAAASRTPPRPRSASCPSTTPTSSTP